MSQRMTQAEVLDWIRSWCSPRAAALLEREDVYPLASICLLHCREWEFSRAWWMANEVHECLERATSGEEAARMLGLLAQAEQRRQWIPA